MSPSTYTIAEDEFLPPRPRTVSDFDPILEIRRIREELAAVFATSETKPANSVSESSSIPEISCDDWRPADATRYIPARTIREVTPSARAVIAPLAEFSPQIDLPPREPDREQQIIARLRNQLAETSYHHLDLTAHEPNLCGDAEPVIAESIAVPASIIAKTPARRDALDAVAVLSALGLLLAAAGGFCIGCGLNNQSDFMRNIGLQSTLTGLVLVIVPYLPLTISRRTADAKQGCD